MSNLHAAHVPDAQRARRRARAVPHALGAVVPARPADARRRSGALTASDGAGPPHLQPRASDRGIRAAGTARAGHGVRQRAQWCSTA
ncbi:MAG: hypothetical protein MZV70_34030 [Desulfobacterales bacterium]|nr:hypothetical protein [Desulfobacterales bacterium]